MGNVVVPLAILAGSGALIFTGITDPEGGAFAGLARLMRGDPAVKRSANTAAFAATAADIAMVNGSTGSTDTGSPLPSSTVPVGSASGVRGRVLAEARTWIGVPYMWGGNSRSGVDCSGLTTQVYSRAAGITLPRVSAAQALVGQARTLATAQPADLVFFAKGGLVHHVGIYAGGGTIIHAPHTGTRVRVEKIWGGETVTVRDVLSGHTTKTKTKTTKAKRGTTSV